MRKVFLENLPTTRGNQIDWKNTTGYKVKFIYDDIEGELQILGYGKHKKQSLKLNYKDQIYHMYTGEFTKCAFSELLGIKSRKYKYEIGSVINGLLLLDYVRIGKPKHKGYTYRCLTCGHTSKAIEGNLTKGRSCAVCKGKKVLKGVNDIHTTTPWLGKLFWDYEKGYEYTKSSGQRADFKCPDCGNKIENKIIANVFKHGISCSRCSDGISYGEKFVFNVLEQIEIGFESQKVFEWSKNYEHNNQKLCGNKKYDFYINENLALIEVHGEQHYTRSINNNSRTINDERENDRIKKELSFNNGIKHYIIIDARKSEVNYIKNSVLNSELTKFFDLSGIDWLKCNEHACNSLVKTVSELYEKGERDLKKIGAKMKLDRVTILKYLKQGAMIGWCNYDPKVSFIESCMKNGERNKKIRNRKIVRLTPEGTYVDEFESATEAGNRLNIHQSNISSACRGKYKSTGGFKWMFKEDYERMTVTN